MPTEGEVRKDSWARSLARTAPEQALSNQGLAGEKDLVEDGTYASIMEVNTSPTRGATTLASLFRKQYLSQGKSRIRVRISSHWARSGNQSWRVVEGIGGGEEKEQETEMTLWSDEPRGADIE